MVCIVLETTLAGGIANDLTVTLTTNVISGTDHTMTGYIYIVARAFLCNYTIKTLLIHVLFYFLSGTASANDISVTAPVQITFSTGDAPSGSPRTRCTTDIMIVNDPDQEPDEIFRVFISDPTHCLGSPAFADVTIQDDDSGR